jgi:glucose/arabinose dehydrogenase
MFSLKKACLCVVLALAACTNNSSSDSSKGGNGGDSGEGGSSASGGTNGGGSGGSGGKNAEGGKAGQPGNPAGGSAGSTMGGQAGSTNQGGSTPSTMRPMVTNKGTCKPPGLKLTKVGTVDSPMQITQAKGDDFMLVAERSGKIQRLKNGALEGVFANYEQSVETMGEDNTSERGLLGLALHPDYDNNGRFFVYYNRRKSDPNTPGDGYTAKSMVIAEGKRMAGDKTKAEPKLTPLLVVPARDDHHIGGFLAFGRDGYLYAGFGDSGGDDKVRGVLSRKFDDLHAKILRMDVDAPTKKVPGNLDKPGAAPQVWVYGVRNPFRGSFDSATGDLYLGDVGEFSFEEIDYVEFGKAPEPDFGWYLDTTDAAKKQADSCGGQTLHQTQTGMEGLGPVPAYQHFEPKIWGFLPIKTIAHDGAGSSAIQCSWMNNGFACGGYNPTGKSSACSRAVIGGVVYRGKKMPDLDGRYIYGEHVQNTVDSFIVKDGAVSCEASLTADLHKPAQTPLQGITSFGTDKDGEIYITDLAGGNIYRIDPK